MDRLQLLRNLVRQGVPCLFHLLTGLYCPGCGGTRAAWYLLHGQVLKSIRCHPLVLYMAAVLSAELAVFLLRKRNSRLRNADGQPGSPPGSLSLPMKRYERETVIGAVILLVNWIFKNYMLVFRGVDLLADRPF